MARVECEVCYVEVESESGHMLDGVEVTCGECGHVETSAGDSGRSIRRCLALLRENCPMGAVNYYVAEEMEEG